MNQSLHHLTWGPSKKVHRSLRVEDSAYEEVQVNEVNVVHTNDGEFEFDNDFEYDSEDQMDTLLDDNEKDNNDEN
ncbi:hypothetical protein S83_028229 [Arachis hypogaea]